jgi:hypothetical protein
MGRYRNPDEVVVSCNYAEASEIYGWPLPFEPRNPLNRKPGQKYLPRSIVWHNDIEPPAPAMTFDEQQEEFMAYILEWGRI